MQLLNLILDTSILSRDKKVSGSSFLLLKKLSQLDLIKLHIPWVVYKEFITQNISEISIDINKALRSIRNINQKGLSNAKLSVLNSSFGVIKSIKEKVSLSVENLWDDFKKESKAEIHDIDILHGKTVMNSYFNESKPFSCLKNRNDIPDAFVYESVCSISKLVGNVIFICEDNNLRKSFNNSTTIKTFESLIQFFNSEDYKPVELEYKKKEHYANELIELTKHISIIYEILNSGMKDFLDSFIDTYVESENIPSEKNVGSIIHIEKINPVFIDKKNIKFINNNFYLKVFVTGGVRIEYLLFIWNDYLIKGRNNVDIIGDDWTNRYYLINESYNFEFSFDCYISKDNVSDIEKAYNDGDNNFITIDEGTASFDNLIVT